MKNKTVNKGSLLKIGDAAQILHVSPQTLRDWTEADKIPAEISDKGHRKYYEAEVNKLALAEKGTTTYWTVNHIVAVSANDDKYYFINPETYESSPIPLVYETDINQYWNFKNGLEVHPRSVVLNPIPVIIPAATLDAFPLQIQDKPNDTLLAQNVLVVGLNKEQVLGTLIEAVALTLRHLRENFKPQQTTIWFTSNGEQVLPE